MNMSDEITVRRDIMGAAEIADYLKVSKSQIFRMAHRVENPLPHFRIGEKLLRFDREKVDSWLLGQEVK